MDQICSYKLENSLRHSNKRDTKQEIQHDSMVKDYPDPDMAKVERNMDLDVNLGTYHKMDKPI